jgi:hypothetical protein
MAVSRLKKIPGFQGSLRLVKAVGCRINNKSIFGSSVVHDC